MKLKKVIVLITTLISFHLKAQSLSDITSFKSSGYWNLSYSIGIGKDIHPNGYIQTPSNGFTYSIDASYTPEKNIGFFANYSSFGLTGNIYNPSPNPKAVNKKYNFSELSVGPRIFSNDKIFFIDAGLGYYNTAERSFIGVNAGAGAKIKVTDSYGVLISGRVHSTFMKNTYNTHPSVNIEPFVYYGIYLGLEMNNNRDKYSTGKKESDLSLAALGGTVSSGLTGHTAGSAFGAEVSYAVSSKVSLLLDYLHSASEMNLSHYNGVFLFDERRNISGNNISGGIRLYLTGNNFKVFVENSANMYFFERTNESSNIYYSIKNKTSNNYFGINFGTGVDFKLVENLSGLFKLNIGTYITEGQYYSGILGGLNYGL